MNFVEGFNMGNFPAIDHDAMGTDFWEEAFVASPHIEHSNRAKQDEEWNEFVQSNPIFEDIEQIPDHDTEEDLFDLKGPHRTIPGTMKVEEPSLVAMSSSSGSTMLPATSTAQPTRIWPMTTGALPRQPPTLLNTGLWTPGLDSHDRTYGNFGHPRLGTNVIFSDVPSTVNNGEVLISDIYNPQYPHSTGERDVGEDDVATASDPCYAKLLYSCLKEVPGHVLPLKEIYAWMKQNSRKVQRSIAEGSPGWQNSVRHNLSLNPAFVKTEGPKGSLWCLSEEALRDGGVQSTTRFRKKTPKPKSERKGTPAPNRQSSGARGGQATRAAARRRREMMTDRTQPSRPVVECLRHNQPQRRNGLESPISLQSSEMSPYLASSASSPFPFEAGLGITMAPLFASTSYQVSPVFGAEGHFALPDFDWQGRG